ncbi:MAG: plasmid mobilization relaxosome protein MobC [Paracoccaceae bacterium]
MLGNLRLANNLNQLAKAANMGALPLSPEVEQELMATCAAVIAIRAELMKALSYPSDALDLASSSSHAVTCSTSVPSSTSTVPTGWKWER